MPTVAIYAGSFDPITRGHEDVIRRSRDFVDHLVVAIATNSAKQPLFTVEERIQLMRDILGDDSEIAVKSFNGLLVDFASSVGASLIIRGLRAVSDFEYEFQMALMNRHMSPKLETVFMVPSVETTYISSSIVREVARYGGDMTGVVHPVVAAALRQKFTPAQNISGASSV
jgi:pantetheine-phosphate adenylyltransferase